MRTILSVVIIVAMTAQPAVAQTKPARSAPVLSTAPNGPCELMRKDWRQVEISLANNAADGIGDSSAPRASLRAQEDANSLSRAALTLELMKLNHCPLPTRAPSAITYLTLALNCATARRTKGADAAECKTENW